MTSRFFPGRECSVRFYVTVNGPQFAAFNRTMIDLAQRNVISGFDLAKKLTEAKNLAEVAELQGAYWRKQFSLTSQTEEIPSLGVKAAGDLSSPSKERARKIQGLRSRGEAVLLRASPLKERRGTW
jgi:hypothetical protein